MNTFDLDRISERLTTHGWHAMSLRLYHASFRAPKFQKPFENDREVYEYLLLHIDEKDAKSIVYEDCIIA